MTIGILFVITPSTSTDKLKMYGFYVFESLHSDIRSNRLSLPFPPPHKHNPKESPTQLQPRLIPRADMAFISPKRPEIRADKLEIGIYWAHWLGVRSIADDDCFHHQGLSISRGEESLFKLMKTSITVKPVGRLSILCGLGGLLGVDLCSLFIATRSFTENLGSSSGSQRSQEWKHGRSNLDAVSKTIVGVSKGKR